MEFDESFIDINEKIWKTLKMEFASKLFYTEWEDYITENIGLSYKTKHGLSLYKIVDKKKWMLAKIKYGF